MYVVCFVEWGEKWWPVWRPAFEYDAEKGLVRVGVGPCALSDLFRGVTSALPKPIVSTGVVDFRSDFGGKFDSTGTAAFESRFGTTGKRVHLVAMSALFKYPTGVEPEVVFSYGVEADVRPLVARLPPELLFADHEEPPVTETLVSNLLKSNCLVTGQPDWGSVQISYSGAPIDQEGLLQYIVSFRNHNEFHEQCVERIFMDIRARCQPTKLTVYARYTRRGGLDINPFRTSHPQALPKNVRTARQ